ncbi:MAG: SDR family oxidoreductase [Cyclobacteriaceae bacterium]
MSSFEGKVAVITGAGSGIGRELAVKLAEAGTNLALCDKNHDTLSETVELLDSDIKVFSDQFDISDREAVFAFAEKVKQEFKQIDYLINNAGAALGTKKFAKTTQDEWEWIMNINLWGVIYGTQAFLPMIKSDADAVIVNLSSMLGLAGMVDNSAYCTTKFAVRGLSETLRMELSGQGIHVMTVHPGAVSTNIIDNARADEETKAKIKHWVSKIGSVSVEDAVTQIVSGIEKKKHRVVIGEDAKKMDWLARLFPNKYTNMVLRGMKKKLNTKD